MTKDYAQISREFLRALRGRRSQAAFSRRLGYRTNVAYVWEAGRAFPTAAQTLSIAERVGIPAKQAVQKFYRVPPTWLEGTDLHCRAGVATLLNDLRGRTSVVELANAAGKSRFAVARWLQGKAEPKLPDFLLLVEKSSLRLLDWLSVFIDPAELLSVKDEWQELEASRRAAYDVPWSQAVLRVLELQDYRALPQHQPGFISGRIGISAEEEERCLDLLSRTGQIYWHQKRWELRQVLAVDTRRDPEAEQRVKRWWAERALERLTKPESGILAYNVFAVSEADYQRVSDLYRAYFRQVRSIIAQSEPSERVILTSHLLVPLDRTPRA